MPFPPFSCSFPALKDYRSILHKTDAGSKATYYSYGISSNEHLRLPNANKLLKSEPFSCIEIRVRGSFDIFFICVYSTTKFAFLSNKEIYLRAKKTYLILFTLQFSLEMSCIHSKTSSLFCSLVSSQRYVTLLMQVFPSAERSAIETAMELFTLNSLFSR